MVAVPSDEISEKYLQKAISETNELGEEIARSAPEGAFPVIGSGHPLADLFMVKYGPQPAEAQEGVAYFGRAGQAILKSLQRLRIDPLAVYGTNCIKFAGQDEEEARSQLTRELHIVQPKLVVVMGDDALAFVNSLAFPLGGADRGAARRAPALHTDDRRARRAGHRRLARRPGRQDELLAGLQDRRSVVGRASAVLTRRVAAGLALLGVLLAYYLFFRLLPNLPTSADVLFVAFVLIPAVFALVWVALPLRRANRLLWIAIGLTALAVASSFAGFEVVANFAKLGAATTVAFWFLGFFETALWVALVALLIPIVDSYSVWRGPTRHIITERPEVFNAFSFSFPLMGERQVFVTWREPLDGPSSFDVYRDPGGKRNDEPIRRRQRQRPARLRRGGARRGPRLPVPHRLPRRGLRCDRREGRRRERRRAAGPADVRPDRRRPTSGSTASTRPRSSASPTCSSSPSSSPRRTASSCGAARPGSR